MFRRPPPRTQAPAPSAGQAGFTLLEVLIALAIVGVALAAVNRAIGMATTNSGVLYEKSLAMLSAQNRMAELQIAGGKADARPQECPQAGLPFICAARIAPAGRGLNTVSVDVHTRQQPERSLASLTTLLAD